MIRERPTPKQLTVVSDDRRIQKAARRGRCPAVGCLEFLEDLNQRRRRHSSPATLQPEKINDSRQDLEIWMKEFAHLDDEKEMKELFGPDFDECE
jgi:hypothetical protein